MSVSGALGSVAFLNAVINDLASKDVAMDTAWKEAQEFQAKTFKPNKF
jgi:hypothetical protein